MDAFFKIMLKENTSTSGKKAVKKKKNNK